MTAKILNLSLGLLFIAVIIVSITTTAAIRATSENNYDDDDAIENEMEKRQDQTKEMAEEALLNGTCLPSLDIMKILAHPDREVAILGTEIPAC